MEGEGAREGRLDLEPATSPNEVAPAGRRFAFPKARRLRRRREFLAVQDGPEARIRGQAFLVLVRAAAGPARLGFVASKRLGGAVLRNRAKRVLRDLFRVRLADLPPGLELVVIAQGAIFRRRFGELERDVARAVRDVVRFQRTGPRPPSGPSGGVAPPTSGR